MSETSYPVAEVAVCSGFFLVYLIEEVIHTWVAHHTKMHEVEVCEADRKLYLQPLPLVSVLIFLLLIPFSMYSLSSSFLRVFFS